MKGFAGHSVPAALGEGAEATSEKMGCKESPSIAWPPAKGRGEDFGALSYWPLFAL